VTTIATFANWRIALITLRSGGFAVAAVLFANRSLLVCASKRTEASPPGSAPQQTRYLGVLLSPVIVMGFAYFALTSFSSQGVQTFGITSFIVGYGFTLRVAMLAVTAYLVGNAVGIVREGFLPTAPPSTIAWPRAGMIVASAMMFLLSGVHGFAEIVVPVMVVAGMAYGITQPSRDIIIRQAAPDGGLGSVFGFVYSGFDLGSATARSYLARFSIITHRTPSS